MAYVVSIVEVTERDVSPKPEWRHIADTGGKDGGVLWDYAVPPGTETQIRRLSIYEQTVAELDLAAVIKAVNGLP